MASVFVSHRKEDADHARRLAEALLADGHAVWFDEWRIDVGDSIVARVDEGLTGARYLLFCLSQLGQTPWMDREWQSALMRQLSGAGVRVLPVRLTGGEPPAILADVRYADLVADWDRGLVDLKRAIR